MPTAVRAAAFPMVLLAALTACGGGGGGGSVIRDVPPSPPLFPASPNQTLVMSGVSLTAEGTNSESTVTPFLLERTATSFVIGRPDDSNSTTTLNYDANGELSGLIISTPTSSISFSAGELLCEPEGCVGVNGAFTSLAAVLDPSFHGWNYQTYGVWVKDVNPTSFQAGAISAGAISPVSALPLSSGTFIGRAGGWYLDSAGALHGTGADMSAIADFGNRRIAFSTSQTVVDGVRNDQLNLVGTLNYGTGNQFAGPVSTQGPAPLTGTATGRFYGSNAEEIGGVYGLGSTTTIERMIGGFGGKR